MADQITEMMNANEVVVTRSAISFIE